MAVVFADTEKRFGRDTRVHIPTLDVTHKTSKVMVGHTCNPSTEGLHGGGTGRMLVL